MCRYWKLVIALLGAAFASPSLAASLADLAWLAGCWSRPGAETGSGEFWLPPAGGTMLGVGRTVRDGKTVDYEFLRLHVDAQGRLVYTATPARQRETAFLATRIDEGTARFENPSHDFPQRIAYTRAGQDRLQVVIEGEREGQLRQIAFEFVRTACP